jgi:predicted secreted protein
MALKGYDGSVSIGATAVGSVKAFSINTTKATVDTTTFDANGWTENESTLRSWTGSVTVIVDPTDAGQVAMVAGLASDTTVALSLVVNSGGGTSQVTYAGSAIITDEPITSDVNSIVEVSMSFTGTGALTRTLGT